MRVCIEVLHVYATDLARVAEIRSSSRMLR
jgi:hypothetical protein